MAEILGALVGGLGAAAQFSSSQEAAQIQLMNLRFQQRMADEQMRMSQATRTDAYGNQQRYNSATNTWETILTPTQKGIVGAGEQEQLKRLTEDAIRNRQILEEERQRGLQAVPDYNKALAGLRYDQAPSRAADEDKLATLLSLQSQDQIGGDKAAVGRTLIRQGRGSEYASLLKAADDAQGQNIGGILAKSYEASIPQFQQDVQARTAHYLPLLQEAQKTMEGGMSSAPTPFSTVPAELNALESQQASLMQSAAQSGAAGVGSAYGAYAKAIGDTGSGFDKLATLLAGIGKNANKGSGQTQYGLVPNTAAYDPGVGYSGGASNYPLTPTWFGGTGVYPTGGPPLPTPRPADAPSGDAGAGFDTSGAGANTDSSYYDNWGW
jgi:hypothetical protein